MGIIQLIPSPAPALGSTLPGTSQAGVRKPSVLPGFAAASEGAVPPPRATCVPTRVAARVRLH